MYCGFLYRVIWSDAAQENMRGNAEREKGILAGGKSRPGSWQEGKRHGRFLFSETGKKRKKRLSRGPLETRPSSHRGLKGVRLGIRHTEVHPGQKRGAGQEGRSRAAFQCYNKQSTTSGIKRGRPLLDERRMRRRSKQRKGQGRGSNIG